MVILKNKWNWKSFESSIDIRNSRNSQFYDMNPYRLFLNTIQNICSALQ